MHRALALALAASAVAAPLAGCAGAPAAAREDVVASFYPMQYLATRVAAGHLSVGVLVPPGAEPHEYELKPSDVARVQGAKVVVLNGAGLEAFVARVDDAARAHGAVVVDASRGLPLLTEPGGTDPHVWLDPLEALNESTAIEAAFERVDAANASAYRAGAEALAADLRALDAEYRAGLATCANPKILTSHASFGYVARRYHFTQFAVSGLSPDAEPSAARVREAAEVARRENVTVVFFETLVSPRVAETIAREVHGEARVLDPIEGLTADARAAGKDYLSLMRENLHALREAMRCA